MLGPNEAESYEAALSVVADLGIPARDAVAIVDADLDVRPRRRPRRGRGRRRRGGDRQTELEWWTERDALLTEKMTPERFPTLARLAADGGFDVPPDTENYNVRFILDDFEFGLQRLLDGIERDLEARRAG